MLYLLLSEADSPLGGATIAYRPSSGRGEPANIPATTACHDLRCSQDVEDLVVSLGMNRRQVVAALGPACRAASAAGAVCALAESGEPAVARVERLQGRRQNASRIALALERATHLPAAELEPMLAEAFEFGLRMGERVLGAQRDADQATHCSMEA